MALTAVDEMNEPGHPEDEQLSWIEGFPASGTRFTLKSVSQLWTDRKLNFEDVVTFKGVGSVNAVHALPTKGGDLVYVYDIQVNEADLIG